MRFGALGSRPCVCLNAIFADLCFAYGAAIKARSRPWVDARLLGRVGAGRLIHHGLRATARGGIGRVSPPRLRSLGGDLVPLVLQIPRESRFARVLDFDVRGPGDDHLSGDFRPADIAATDPLGSHAHPAEIYPCTPESRARECRRSLRPTVAALFTLGRARPPTASRPRPSGQLIAVPCNRDPRGLGSRDGLNPISHA